MVPSGKFVFILKQIERSMDDFFKIFVEQLRDGHTQSIKAAVLPVPV